MRMFRYLSSLACKQSLAYYHLYRACFVNFFKIRLKQPNLFAIEADKLETFIIWSSQEFTNNSLTTSTQWGETSVYVSSQQDQ